MHNAGNLRDNGVRVLVGCPPDAYRDRAAEDGFEVRDVAASADAADAILVLIPDEVQPTVYEESILPGLREGDTIVFASGYNIHFKLIEPPPSVDVVMVAPRMIGSAARELFVQGKGFPCLVAVAQDHSGGALNMALALARAIGGTRAGTFASSFEEEVLIDLFAEQFLWAGVGKLCRLYYDLLVKAGCTPETVATEMYLSGEMVEVAQAMVEQGFFKQLELHSRTSQYGQLSRADAALGADAAARAQQILAGIRSGDFAREWTSEQQRGAPQLAKLKEEAFAHPLNEVERTLRGRQPSG